MNPGELDLPAPQVARLDELARAAGAAHPGAALVSATRMFGANALLVGGNLAVAPSRRGILVRVDPDLHDELMAASAEATTMEMRGREMHGWIRVDPTELDDAAIDAWMRRGLDHAASLPAK